MSISKLCFPYNKHKELDTGVVAFIANAIFFVGVFKLSLYRYLSVNMELWKVS